MNSDLIGIRTLRLQLWAMVFAGFFQSREFVQQVVGLFALPGIAKQLADVVRAALPERSTT